MKGYATREGTFEYLKKFPKYSKDFYRYDGERFVSSLGLGTFRKEPYREENYVVNYKDSLKMALLNGINHIDTAINYRYQVSEKEIGEALNELFEEGKIKREEIFVCSKAGFIPLNFPFPKDPYEWIENNIIKKGLAFKEDIVIDQHCITPEYLRWSVEKSLENLGLETLDVVYLHNPEVQLGYIDYTELMQKIQRAFKEFEKLVDEGKICAYGVAAWNAFLYEDDHTEYISLKDIVDAAVSAGGENNHLKYIQSPYNLVKNEAFSYPNQMGPDGKYYTLMQAIQGNGLYMVGSSSLLQMNIFKGKFNPDIAQKLGTTEFNDVISALQFARSSNVVSSLFGAVNPQHVEDNLLLAYLPNPSKEKLLELFGERIAV